MQSTYLFTPALKINSLINFNGWQYLDALVIDFEDSIHYTCKEEAREFISSYNFNNIPCKNIGLRINSIATIDGIRDLLWLYETKHKLFFKMLFVPKIKNHNELMLLKSIIREYDIQIKIISIIEDVDAINDLDNIAKNSDALILGQADLVANLYAANFSYISHARSMITLYAAKYNIPVIDTNSFEMDDMDKFRAECINSKNEGFIAKAAIHPKQISIIKEVFAITQDEIDEYHCIIDEYNNSRNGLIIKNGLIIAPPFVAKAKKILKLLTS